MGTESMPPERRRSSIMDIPVMFTDVWNTERRHSIRDLPTAIKDVVNAERSLSIGTYPDHDQRQPDKRMAIPPKPMPSEYRILNALHIFWKFTASDFATFVMPNSAYSPRHNLHLRRWLIIGNIISHVWCLRGARRSRSRPRSAGCSSACGATHSNSHLVELVSNLHLRLREPAVPGGY